MGSNLCKNAENSNPLSFQNERNFSKVGGYFSQLLSDKKYMPVSSRSAKYPNGDPQLNRLMCILQQHSNIPFQDQLYPKEQMINDKGCKWIRAQQLFRWEKFRSDNWNFVYESQNNAKPKYQNDQFKIAMLQLSQKWKQQLTHICVYDFIFKPGMYRFIFYINGQSRQILIDSFIPSEDGKKYLSYRPRKGSGIWMILVEKALAKTIGSYNLIRKLKKQQILSHITGYPCPALYNSNHKRDINYLQLKPRMSQYFKLSSKQKSQLAFGLWFPLDATQQTTEQNLIIELIELINNNLTHKYRLVATTQTKTRNIIKITSNNQMINLANETHYLHIYNQSGRQIRCNIVSQYLKDFKVNFNISKQSNYFQCKNAKNKMVKQQYAQIAHNKSQTTLLQTSNYRLRTTHIRHRIILCFKNITNKKITIKVSIKQDKKHQFFFEDQPYQRFEQIKQIKPTEHGFFIFTHLKQIEIGQFYEIIVQ